VAAPTCPHAVDDCLGTRRLACIVPKRHARRAVTRSLLKRQIRQTFSRHAASLPAGQWLVRLRSGFAVAAFPSAASPALAGAARAELEQLMARLRAGS